MREPVNPSENENPREEPRRPVGVYFHGYYAAVAEAAECRDEIDAVVAALRAEGLYEYSDPLRDIAKRLDDAVTYPEPSLRRKVCLDSS